MLGIVLLISVILSIVFLRQIGELKRRVSILEEAAQSLDGSVSALQTQAMQLRSGWQVPLHQPEPTSVQTREDVFELPAAPAAVDSIVASDLPRAAAASSAAPTDRSVAPQTLEAPWPSAPSVPPPPNRLETALRAVRRWFTVGNVPVKIGMLVLLAGVASLLKYASDQGWLRMPPELRLAGIALAALAGLVVGWRKRTTNPAFALAMQGGMIGILLMVVFAAYRLFDLIPSGAAFGLSVVLIAGLGALAVLQDSRTLAVLGVLAGFMAPIWLSNGGGNHVALFSYYAVLNVAIFAIALMRSWRILNLLGFAFTWTIGLAWGVLRYEPGMLNSTQPFLWLFFAIYLVIPILFARRRPARMRDRIDACLLFGTPLIAFLMQAGLMPDQPLRLGLYALLLAALYAVLAAGLRKHPRYTVLAQAHALLAVAFATLSVPLALSARATAAIFALEGAGMVWLGLRQQRRLPLWSGLALQLAAAVAFMFGISGVVASAQAPITNAAFMSGLLIALGGWASALALHRAGRPQWAAILYGWGLWWWLGNGGDEIAKYVADRQQPDALLMLTAATGWLAAEAFAAWRGRPLAWTTLGAFACAAPLALLQMQAHVHPFAGLGGVAWAVYAVLGVRSLVRLRAGDSVIAGWAQFVWWLIWPLVSSLFLYYVAQRLALAQGWAVAGAALPWLLATAVALHRPQLLSVPLGERFQAYLPYLRTTYLLVLAVGWLMSLPLHGEAAPLPWVPIANPLELIQLAALLLVARAGRLTGFGRGIAELPMLGVAAFAWITAMTLRATHFWGDAPWSMDMFSISLVQTSLTLVWSVLGVAAWIAGSRYGQRTLWLAGALLMGVVLAKLVLVDRQYLGNLFGIGSFIGYGLLCTVVGYVAPAPPRGERREMPA